MISVLILTKDEEKDLPGCLASVSWSDDIHVFDSESTDRTAEIAVVSGAKLTRRTFDGYASQRNAALHGLEFRYPWALILDADERIPTPLAEEIRAFVRNPPANVVACRIRRRDLFMGTWLKHAQLSPYYIRLVRPERVRYEREINEVLHADGPIHDLREPFDHFPFSKGLAHWFDKHNRYSTLEARILLQSRRGAVPFSLRKALCSGDFHERRSHQKAFFYRLPGRPLIKWLYMVALRGAYLDGRAGLTYATLQFIYECMISIKTIELEAGEGVASAAVPVVPSRSDDGDDRGRGFAR